MNASYQIGNISNSQLETIELDPFDSFLRIYEGIPRFLYYEAPIILYAVGTVLNSILFVYLIKAKKYKSPLFMFITSMCVSDLILCISVFALPIFIVPWMAVPGTSLLCPIIMYLIYGACFVSTYHLVLFSIMRFYQLCYPLKARSRVTAGLVVRCCVSIFVIGYASRIPFFFLHFSIQVPYRDRVVCICEFHGDVQVKDIVLSVLEAIIPFLTICFFHIYKHLRLAKAKLDIGQKRRNTDTRAVTIVIVIFFVAWVPYLLHSASHEYFNAPKYSFHYIVYMTEGYFAWANSALNPLVYSLASKTIRRDLIKVLFR